MEIDTHKLPWRQTFSVKTRRHWRQDCDLYIPNTVEWSNLDVDTFHFACVIIYKKNIFLYNTCFTRTVCIFETILIMFWHVLGMFSNQYSYTFVCIFTAGHIILCIPLKIKRIRKLFITYAISNHVANISCVPSLNIQKAFKYLRAIGCWIKLRLFSVYGVCD